MDHPDVHHRENGSGQIVGAETDRINVLFANGKTGLGGETSIDGATSLEFQIVHSSNMWEDDTQQVQMDEALPVSDITVTNDGYGSVTVEGQVTSNAQTEITLLPANVIIFDSDGNIVAGAQSYIDTPPPGSTLPFDADFYAGVPKYAEVKAYVGFGY